MTYFDEADDPGWLPPDGDPPHYPLFEPPPDDRSPEDSLPPVETLSPYLRRRALFGQFLDDTEVADRQLAVAAAARVRSIDELRQVSVQIAAEEAAEDATKPTHLRANAGQENGWSIQNRAKTELTTEIAMAFTISKDAARHLIEECATLVADLPETLNALERGLVRYEHVRLIASTAWSLPQDARAAFEDEVLPWAKTLIYTAFKNKVLAAREKVDTTPMEVRHEKAAAGRSVTVDPSEDGMGYLTIHDSTEVLVAIHNRVTDIARTTFAGDPRSLAQRRTDVTTELLLKGDLCATTATTDDDDDANGVGGGKGLGHGIVARVNIEIPVLTLLGVDNTPATLDGTIPIDPATARRLLADAPGFYRLLTDPITGSVVAFDNKFRYLPKSLRRAVELIDGKCTAPWCNASAHNADGHHPDEWADSHTTSLENSALVCPPDHRLIHNTRWTMVKLPSGDKQWISPCGRVKKVAPMRRLSPAFVEALKSDQPQPDSWNTPTNTDEEMPF